MELKLNGKAVIVTGGAQGMGYAIARGFLEEGAGVLLSDVDEGRLAAAVGELSAFGRVVPCVCNVMKEEDVKAMVDACKSAFGSVDILVNNAGVLRPKAVAEMSGDDWDFMLNVNLKSVFLCSKYAYLAMAQQGKGGFIANASSFSALIPSVSHGAYAAAKEGVISLTRTCAAEFAPAKVRVISYTPGVVATQLTDAMRADPETSAKLLQDIPLREYAQPGDIANVIVYLSSEKAGYVTGCNIEIHGGKLCVQNPEAAY